MLQDTGEDSPKKTEESSLIKHKVETTEPNGKTSEVLLYLENLNGKMNPDESEPLHCPPTVRRFSEIVQEQRDTEESTCGMWCLKGRFFQMFANKKAYVVLYGVLGCVMSASGAYLVGTITTLEKQFKIPTTNTGIIMVGNDISRLALCIFLNYYGGRGHRPRWIGFGICTLVAYCLLNALPHFLYGANQESLDLTEEFSGSYDTNTTAELIVAQNRKSLCQVEGAGKCDDVSGNLAPQVILFLSKMVNGVGGSLIGTLGIAYLDDNVQKSKSPALTGLTMFLRMLGPACGLTLASACLSLYVSPSLTPTITKKDPRWLGAWWLGWLFLGGLMFVFAWLMAMFPRTLPRAAARKVLASERRMAGLDNEPAEDHTITSLADMMKTLKTLALNKTLMCNNFAAIFYFTGYLPYYLFMPKYIETVYRQSASASNLYTGTIGMVCSAIGLLMSGLCISKYRPKARSLAAWNVGVGVITAVGIVGYINLGCPTTSGQAPRLESGLLNTTTSCNVDCHCDYVKYAPVCSPDGRTFISPCHAGCRDYHIFANGSKVFTDCSCAPKPSQLTAQSNISSGSSMDQETTGSWESWALKEGACSIDCANNFYIFLAIVCIVKVAGATGRTSNLFVSVRCVDVKDKTVAMGFGLTLMSLLAFLPAPIFYGHLYDTTCLVWGKTCTGTGNCWLYNAETLVFNLNIICVSFIVLGTMFDFAVWYFVKDLKIFDSEDKAEPEKLQEDKIEINNLLS